MCSVVCGDGAGVALRAESRITPPKIQGGAAEVNTPATFPTLSHNFGKPRSARRIRAARAGLERSRQAAADSIPPRAKLVRLFALRAAFSVKITHGGIDSAVSAFSAWETPPASLRSAAPSGRGPASPGLRGLCVLCVEESPGLASLGSPLGEGAGFAGRGRDATGAGAASRAGALAERPDGPPATRRRGRRRPSR